MSGRGRVLQAAQVSDAEMLPVLQLTVDAPWASGGERAPTTAVYVDRVDPHPALGDLVEWTTRHVIWHLPGGEVRRLRKRGYAFNPSKQ